MDNWEQIGGTLKIAEFTVLADANLLQALEIIDANSHGLLFVIDPIGKLLGVISDGDIRRHLLHEGNISDNVLAAINIDFVWASNNDPREKVLKLLDARIKVVPIVDENFKIVDLVSRQHLPLLQEGNVYSRSRAPVRVSFGGGGSDVTNYFAGDDVGAVINSTVSLFTHATLKIRKDYSISIYSADLKEELHAESLQAALTAEGNFGLFQAVLKLIKPDFGFDLYVNSDFPVGSGLGGSAVVTAAILGCFNEFRIDKWTQHEIAEIAYQSERHYLGIAGGWQDQYATVFGGFNFMEFRMDENIVQPLRISSSTLIELEENLVMCDTGIAHDSSSIHDDQRAQMDSKKVQELVEKNVQLCFEMRNFLLRGQLDEFGKSLDQAWKYKRQFSQKISSKHIDSIYDGAISSGAIGGKLLGAGGGGFFLFYVPPFARQKLIDFLSNQGLAVRNFLFEPNGLTSWTVRDN